MLRTIVLLTFNIFTMCVAFFAGALWENERGK